MIIIGEEWITLCWWGRSGGAIHTPCYIDIISYVVFCLVCNRDRIDCGPLRQKFRCLQWYVYGCLLRSACPCLVRWYILCPSSWCSHCVEGSHACCIQHIDWGWFGFLWDWIDCGPLRQKSCCLLWCVDGCLLRSACRCLVRWYVLCPFSWCSHCVEGSHSCCIQHIDWGWFGFLCNQKLKNISNIWSIKNKHDD